MTYPAHLINFTPSLSHFRESHLQRCCQKPLNLLK